jgi:hypothetical protein
MICNYLHHIRHLLLVKLKDKLLNLSFYQKLTQIP